MQTKFFLALCMSLFVAVGCSHRKEKKAEERAVHTAANVNATEYTTITFDKGEKELSEMNKHYLHQLTEKAANDGRKIEEIKILAWGDKEYSLEKKATKAEVNLAKNRAEKVKTYLEANMKKDADIDSVNMAKKPSMWDEMVRNEEYKTKEAFQTEQMTSKASKAMVIVEYESI